MASSRTLVRRLRRTGAKMSPLAEMVVGFALLVVPVPEPATEIATDVGGAAMMAHAAHRIRHGGR